MRGGVGPRGLGVDDEPGVRRELERGLRAEGMQVVTASDGPSGLRAALTGSFDAVLLDIMLPGLSGYRVLERLRAAGVGTPVLLVSAKDGEVDQADGLDLGADGYLVKPFSFVVLVAQVRALLRRRHVPAHGRRLRLSELLVDPATRQVSWAGRLIAPPPRQFAVLFALASRPDLADFAPQPVFYRRVVDGLRDVVLVHARVYRDLDSLFGRRDVDVVCEVSDVQREREALGERRVLVVQVVERARRRSGYLRQQHLGCDQDQHPIGQHSAVAERADKGFHQGSGLYEPHRCHPICTGRRRSPGRGQSRRRRCQDRRPASSYARPG